MIAKIQELVGKQYVLTDPSDLQEYGVDWSKADIPAPLAIVLPASTSEVSQVLGFCHRHKLAVVPSGGRTGLAGGAVAAHGEVVINLKRMNNIVEVDDVGMTIHVQAGVTTQAVQEAAVNAGAFFALDLAAKGSSQIGGNLATNAGGLKLIRYGGAREQVIGLEVVLADGTILNLNHQLRKNNVGYDLKQIFIGSEGTLGIITEATLRMVTKPRELQLCCLAVPDAEAMMSILKTCHQSGMTLTAFEFFDHVSLELVLKHHQEVRCPFEQASPLYVLLEFEVAKSDDGDLTTLLEGVFEAQLAIDGVIATSHKELQEIWSLRELISESLTMEGRVRKNDVSVPIRKIAEFLEKIQDITRLHADQIKAFFFGHVGDGNVHINYVGDFNLDRLEFEADCKAIEEQVFQTVRDLNGSISAEHGIGILKKHDLHYSCSDTSLRLMKAIKMCFDQNLILNPGKIFDM